MEQTHSKIEDARDQCRQEQKKVVLLEEKLINQDRIHKEKVE